MWCILHPLLFKDPAPKICASDYCFSLPFVPGLITWRYKMEDSHSQNKPEMRRKPLPQTTIASITPKVSHDSHLRHPDESAENDTFEFTEFPQSYLLTRAPSESDTPLVDVRDANNRRDKEISNYTGSNLSTSKFSFLGALMDWRLETASCFLAIISLLAVVATLYLYNGQPLPKLPSGLSLNSLISICIVVMKATMSLILAQGTDVLGSFVPKEILKLAL
jgi:hypothetical protein